jgi:folate-binding protein YgfZ
MFIKILDRSLLKISGNDAESFLHAQLSNDIRLLDNNNIQLSCFCQHQGKIISLFWVMRSNDGFLISFPSDLVDKVIARLQMFVIMSEVKIEDLSNELTQIGLINESNASAYKINDNLSLLINVSGKLYSETDTHSDEWNRALIEFQIPEVFLSSSEKFVPQMLNLDINEIGVNFSKGCYPGQEVVARLHYLGEAKRRLFSFKSDSKIQIGDSLYCASSRTAKARGNRYKGSGIVVNSVKFNSVFYCLATLDTELLDCEITLNNEHGPILEKINNE